MRPPGRKFSVTILSWRARSPRGSGTVRPAHQRRSRWPTSWGWCSPGSIALPVGANASPRSKSPRLSYTAAATFLPGRERRGDRAGDPRGAAARARRGRHCDAGCGGRQGRRGDARARVAGSVKVGSPHLIGAHTCRSRAEQTRHYVRLRRGAGRWRRTDGNEVRQAARDEAGYRARLARRLVTEVMESWATGRPPGQSPSGPVLHPGHRRIEGPSAARSEGGSGAPRRG